MVTHDPRLSTVRQDHLALVLRSQLHKFVVDVLDHEVGGVLDAKVGNEADGEFACTLSAICASFSAQFTLDRTWNDSLGSNGSCRWSAIAPFHRRFELTEGPLDTVQRQTGVS